jgi:hypothetical protein
MTDHEGVAPYDGPPRFGADALLRPAGAGDQAWAKIRSENGITVAGRMVEDHGDGSATIALGDFFHVRGEVLARGVVHQFGPREVASPRLEKSLNGPPLKPLAAW